MNHTCARVTRESGIAVALLVPLAINPFSSHPFEPLKAIMFYAATALMIVACIVSFLLGNRRYRRAGVPRLKKWPSLSAMRNSCPMLFPIVGYAMSYMFATVASVNPRLSFWGSEEYRQGAVTALFGGMFSLFVVAELRTAVQVGRLIRALLAGTVPVSIYGLVQYIGLDPLNWATDSVSPVLSSLGRSNFVAAYLAMVIPFTVAHILATSRKSSSVGYSLLLALQITCLLLTLSRAGWLSFVSACVVFFSVIAFRWKSRVALIGVIATMIIGGFVLATMNSLPVPAQPLGASPRRQLALPDYQAIRELSIQQRLVMWRITAGLIPARLALGYGPETFAEVFANRPSAELLSVGLAERTFGDPHNLVLSLAFGTGIVGLASFAWVLCSLVVVALRTTVQSMDRRIELMTAAGLSSVTAFVIQSQFNPQVIVPFVLFWIDVAIVVAAYQLSRSADQSISYCQNDLLLSGAPASLTNSLYS